MRFVNIIIALYVTFTGLNVNAQSGQSYGIEGIYHVGFLSAHHEGMGHLVDKHIKGAEVLVFRQTNGAAAWQQIYSYPRTGFSFLFLDLPSDTVIGNAFGLMTFVDLPVFKTNKYYFSIRPSIGLGYLTKHFQRIDNYKNNTIGSALNAAVQVNFQNNFKVSDRIQLHLNVGLTHFSNASFSTPNLGLNNFTLNTGISYLITEPDTFYKRELPDNCTEWEYEIILAAGVKEIYPPDGNKYFESTFMMNAMKQLSHKTKLGGGMDVFYDPVLITKMERDGKSVESVVPVRGGVHGEYQMLLGKLSLLFDVGIYLIDPAKQDGYVYNRIGLRYNLSSKLLANISLKCHYAKAEYAEWGLGYKFGKCK